MFPGICRFDADDNDVFTGNSQSDVSAMHLRVSDDVQQRVHQHLVYTNSTYIPQTRKREGKVVCCIRL